MVFVASLGLPTLMVSGDSQVVINWANSKACLDVVDMVHWCELIEAIKSSFLSLKFFHIYMEHNSSADALSKESLTLYLGKLSYLEIMEGDMIGSDTVLFF